MIKSFCNHEGDLRRIDTGFGLFKVFERAADTPTRFLQAKFWSKYVQIWCWHQNLSWNIIESSRQPNLALEHGKSHVYEWFTCCCFSIVRWDCRRVVMPVAHVQIAHANRHVGSSVPSILQSGTTCRAILWTWPEHWTIQTIQDTHGYIRICEYVVADSRISKSC